MGTELKQVNAALRRGLSTVDVNSRGQVYAVDLCRMKQTNATSGKSRDVREVNEDGEELQSDAKQGLFLSPRCLKQIGDDFAHEDAKWTWEQDDQWKSYEPQTCHQLDCYYAFYCAHGLGAAGPHLARLRLAKQEAIVDFEEMTTKVSSAKPRKIRRELRETDWCSNAFFFDAFKAALSRAGVEVQSSPDRMFDFRFNQDFRMLIDDGRVLFRGGMEYRIPVGWKRFAVNVKGQYDDGANTWLKDDEDGWAVAYHGTAEGNLPGILATGFRVGPRQKFEKECGKGVYCTPELSVAAAYAPTQDVQGHSVQILLQLRVKPSAIRKVTPHCTDFDYEKHYWVINDPSDMRAYGVLIRKDA